jgi:hypothetical protein
MPVLYQVPIAAICVLSLPVVRYGTYPIVSAAIYAHEINWSFASEPSSSDLQSDRGLRRHRILFAADTYGGRIVSQMMPLSPVKRRDFLFGVSVAGAGVATGTAIAAEAPALPNGESSFGKCPDDQKLRAAWQQFCRRLEQAGDFVFKKYNPPTPLMRADGYRYLAQNLGQAFDLAYETKDPKYPVIHAFCTPFCKLGDNADCVYQQAWIDGESIYRISGNRGTVRFLNFTVHGPRPEKQPGTDWPSLHDPFGDSPEANIFGYQLATDWDGSFELYIGGPKREGNWLPTTKGSRKIFIRQVFDSFSERPARIRIERIGMLTPRPMPMPDDMIKAMDWAGDFMTGVMHDWPDFAFKYTKSHFDQWVNQFPPEFGDTLVSDRRRGRAIAGMYWELKPDEAMIIEFKNHNGFWMFTNMALFCNSMDYLYRPVSFTPSRTKVDSDGMVRLIMAHDDPGYYNWMDTQAFDCGNLNYRNFLSDDMADIRTRVVKRSQLAAALPRDTAKVTRDERIAQLRERFQGITMRYSL